MSVGMKAARQRMEKDYVEKNNAFIEEKWGQSTNSEKAKLWPKRLIQEFLKEFPGPHSGVALIVEVDDWGNQIEQAARAMGVSCEMMKKPDHSTGQRVVVLGLDPKAVRSEFAQLSREADLLVSRANEEKKRRREEAQRDFEAQYTSAKSLGRNLKGKWDISGEWAITCPYTEESWGSEDDECSLRIGFTEPDKNGLVEVYADFYLIVLRGIMRFINTGAQAIAPEKAHKRKFARTRERSNSDSDSTEIRPSAFLFPKASLPCSGVRNFAFRWRGEETGEGEIQLGSERHLCSIEFASPNALHGNFQSDLTEKTEFWGFKTGPCTSKEIGDPSYAWESRDENAYEEARIRRWR